MMEKIGLVAGAGSLPVEFVRSARAKGDKVVVYAIEGMASRELDNAADKTYWLNIGQFKKFIFLLIKERIRKLALLGKVDKGVIYDKKIHDEEASSVLSNVENKKDYSILEEITRRLKILGIEVIKGTDYLAHLLPEKGVMGQILPDDRIRDDIEFGVKAAKRLADMDIGQTIVVKDKTIVAVEAMEGTNATIRRAREIAGDGCTMIKVSRIKQDMRWDIPTVGPETITLLGENNFGALAIESGNMFVIDKERFLQKANESNIVVEAV